MTDHPAARLLDHEQEAEPLLRIERLRSGMLGLNLVQFLDPAEPGHDRWRIEQAELQRGIAVLDRTQDQTFGFCNDVNHAASPMPHDRSYRRSCRAKGDCHARRDRSEWRREGKECGSTWKSGWWRGH